jgi:hypothetical protein
LQGAFTPTATIETIGDLVKLAPRLATARTMATLLRRYRDFDARAVALEGAMEETVNGWQEYNERQAEIAMGTGRAPQEPAHRRASTDSLGCAGS